MCSKILSMCFDNSPGPELLIDKSIQLDLELLFLSRYYTVLWILDSWYAIENESWRSFQYHFHKHLSKKDDTKCRSMLSSIQLSTRKPKPIIFIDIYQERKNGIIFHHLQKKTSMTKYDYNQVRLQPSPTKCDQIRPSTTKYNYNQVRPSTTKYNQLQPSTTKYE